MGMHMKVPVLVAAALLIPTFKMMAADLPEGQGKEIILRACTGCHKAEAFLAYRYTKDEYQSIVLRMGQRGASASKEELDTVAAYLSKNFPKVDDPTKLNINKANAKELAAGLGLTAEEAAAIVGYRDRHGSFRAVGDLYIIYGLDGLKIEAQKDKITF
jgi:competence ComEA-like helix-hairpin-helix protein